jgi:high-affinity Fe2+/Pb2+ permease
VKTLAVARIRAIIGAAFALLGAGIAVQLLLRPEPLQQKLLGLGFALVLIALGVVRVRGYLALRKTQA